MSAREEILGRVREALADVHQPDPASDLPVSWQYGRATEVADPVALFVERVEDYRASVCRVADDELVAAVVAELQATGARSVVLPPALPDAWRAAIETAGLTIVEDAGLTAADLNRCDAVVTACAVAIAETGTIVLDHAADQGRRALSLVPDRHVCVVRTGQIVTDVPEAVARLGEAVGERRPQTWISGGSASSDIELSRVEGVHGPRQLRVVVVD